MDNQFHRNYNKIIYRNDILLNYIRLSFIPKPYNVDIF